MPENLASIIVRLETASSGSTALSKDVLHGIGWEWERMGCPGGGMWKTPEERPHCGPLPIVTEEVGAARALVPQELSVVVEEPAGGAWAVALYDQITGPGDGHDPLIRAVGNTLPLALCAAALKARQLG